MAQNARLAWGADPRPLCEMVDLATAYAASRPEFAEALHAAIDGPPAIGVPDLSPLTRKEYEKERSRLSSAIAEGEIELERRAASRRKAEAERELAAVEEKAAAALAR